jgi:hypothetical protein
MMLKISHTPGVSRSRSFTMNWTMRWRPVKGRPQPHLEYQHSSFALGCGLRALEWSPTSNIYDSDGNVGNPQPTLRDDHLCSSLSAAIVPLPWVGSRL